MAKQKQNIPPPDVEEQEEPDTTPSLHDAYDIVGGVLRDKVTGQVVMPAKDKAGNPFVWVRGQPVKLTVGPSEVKAAD